MRGRTTDVVIAVVMRRSGARSKNSLAPPRHDSFMIGVAGRDRVRAIASASTVR